MSDLPADARAVVITVSDRSAVGARADTSGPAAAELLAQQGFSVAGVAARTLIVNLPGSTGGVRDGVAALAPVVGHAVQQLRGGDH